MIVCCPCCSHGFITLTNICNHCGVAMSRGVLQPDVTTRPTPRWRRKRKQDQDIVGPYTDYARTKQDQ